MRVSAWLYLMEQTLVSACLLRAIGLSAGLQRASPWRLALLSGMLAALTMASLGLPPVLRLLFAPLTALAPLAAWPGAPRRLRLRMALTAAALPLTLTGLMRLMAPTRLPGLLLLAAGCGGVMLAARSAAGAAVPRCTTVELCLGARRTTLTALVDTGNLLRDGVTGLPVIVISRRAASRLMALPEGTTLRPGMRLMSVRTISGRTLMTILRPDAVRLKEGGRWREAHALIGLSPDGYEGFQALVPACLVSCADPLPRQQAARAGEVCPD